MYFKLNNFSNGILKNSGGNIINIIDQRVFKLTPFFFSYTISKTGLYTLTKTSAMSLAPNIRVNGIAPGPTLKNKRQSAKQFKKQDMATPLKRQVDVEQICNAVDFFNIMAYDDFSTTVPYKHHSDMALAQTSLNYWITTRGMPASKAVLGIPAYGRPSGITQTGTVLTYSTITNGSGSALSDSAVVSAGGFNNYTIYYNGLPTVKRKAKLAQSMANGIMMWEKGQDRNDGLSLLKAVCDTLGRSY